MAVPTADSSLRPYTTNMNGRLVASGVSTYFLNAGEVSQYTSKHEAYIEALTALTSAREAGTWAETQTMLKSQAKSELLGYAREIYAIVQANPDISDVDKTLLGINVRLAPVKIPRPGLRPGVKITGVANQTVAISICDDSVQPSRAKPPAVFTAMVYSFVGSDYPSDPAKWDFEGPCNGRKAEIVFNNSLPAGTEVWICVAWLNQKMQAGPTSIPLSTNLQGGGSSAEAV